MADIRKWTGAPDGWVAFRTRCGHNHGVKPTKKQLYIDIIKCYLRPWRWPPYRKEQRS